MARKKRSATRSRKKKKKKATSRRRKGRWSAVTYEELDGWRAEQGIPKNRMANMLGVTNSTYHNWARGVSTPTAKTQERIRKILDRSGPDVLGAGAAAAGGGNSEREAAVMRATGMIVEGYLKAKGKGMTPAKLNELIREVKRALVS